MRLPLTPQITTKDGVSNKNSRLTNCLKETKTSGDKVVIRPGLVLNAVASGVGNGLVVFNQDLVSVYGATIGAGIGEELSGWQLINSQLMTGKGCVTNNGTTALQLEQSTVDGYNWTSLGAQTIEDATIIAIGADFYGLIQGGGQLVMSSDSGATWDYVADFPGTWGTGQLLWYAGNATLRLYWYDIDNMELWRSSDLGVTWTQRFPSTPPSLSQCFPIQVGTVLYLFDGVNGTYETSTNFQDFTSGSLYSTSLSIGYYSAGDFYGYNFSTGDVISIPESAMNTATVLGNVPPATDINLEFIHQGQPFQLGNASYIFGLGGVYRSGPGIPAVGTITGTSFDFAQSPL